MNGWQVRTGLLLAAVLVSPHTVFAQPRQSSTDTFRIVRQLDVREARLETIQTSSSRSKPAMVPSFLASFWMWLLGAAETCPGCAANSPLIDGAAVVMASEPLGAGTASNAQAVSSYVVARRLHSAAAGQVPRNRGRDDVARTDPRAAPPSRHEQPGNPGALLWEDHFDQSQGFEAPLAAAAQHGKVAVVGIIAGGNDPAEGLLRTYDGATGSLLWQDRFDVRGGDEQTHAVVVTPDLVVVGGIATNVEGDYAGFVRAYGSRSGRLQWMDVFDVEGTIDSVEAFAVHGNRLFVTGGLGHDLIARAYRLDTGRLLWEARHDSAGGFDGGFNIAATGDLVFVCGYAGWVPDEFVLAFYVAAFSARTGALVWEDQINAPGIADTASGIVAHGGRVYVAGSSNDDWLVRAYRASNGRVRWEDVFSLAGPDIAFHVTADEKYVVAVGYGASAPSRQSRDWVTRAYDAKTGTLLWADQFDFGANRDGAVGGVAVGRDMAFVYGERTGASRDMFLRAYHAGTGEVLWEDVIDKSGLDDAPSSYPSIALDGRRVTIVGWSEVQRSDGTSDLDWIVRTYDASKR